MNYTSRYGLEFNPFIKNSKDVLVETNDYKELIFRLNYLVQTKGFGVLTGGPGRGKTTMIRHWVKSLNQSAYKVIYIPMSTLTVMEFYRQLAEALGLEAYHRKSDNFKAIQKAIERYTIEKRMTLIIILDEANYLRNGILNDLKILFNFEMDSSDQAVVLLAGLPQLNNTFNLAIHEPLKQRIVMNYHIENLNKEDSRKYIQEKLKGAGCHQQVFEASAVEAIINASNGVPRLINQLCNKSLLAGNNRNQNVIDTDTVMMAFNDNELG